MNDEKKYYSYNYRTGGFHTYTEEEFQKAKKFYKLYEKVIWDDFEAVGTCWLNRGNTIQFGLILEDKQ